MEIAAKRLTGHSTVSVRTAKDYDLKKLIHQSIIVEMRNVKKTLK